MPPVFYKPAAKAELRETFCWYEEREAGLGSEFMRAIEAIIQLIRRHPEIFPAVQRNIRRAIIRRFPYSIFYLLETNKIVVLAVFHASRNPSNWPRRQTSS